MLAVYVVSVLFLLVLFVLITSIEFTLDAEARHREEKSLLRGKFGVRWLFFSRSVSIEKPGKKGYEDKSKTGKEREMKEEAEAEKEKETEAEKEKETEAEMEKEIEKKIEREIEKKIEGIGKKTEKKTWTEKGGEKEKRVEGIEKEKKETKEPRKFWKKEYSYILRALRYLRQPLFRLFSDTLNALKVKHLYADFTFGLPDPADTGMLCGFAHSLVGVLYGRCRKCSVYINPVFMDPVLDFQGNTKISIKIYSLVFSFLKFILNRNTLSFTYSIIKEWIQGKWKVNPKAL